MRRKDRNLCDEEALEIIDNSEYAVISCVDESGGVFSIPISMAREGMSVYIHGAVAGSKARLFKDGKDVKMVCVSYNKVPKHTEAEFEAMKDDGARLASRVFTTEYKSAITETKAYLVAEDTRKIKALRLLSEKYTPEYMSAFETAAYHGLNHLYIYELKIKSISAKAKIL